MPDTTTEAAESEPSSSAGVLPRPRIGGVCSGIGALERACESVFGAEVAWVSEIDKGACEVLATRLPDVPNIGNLTELDWSTVEHVDIFCGGFPCQPISSAGRRKVKEDERWIWPAIADAIRVVQPRYVCLENVSAIVRPWRDGDGSWRAAPVETVIGDLARLGYVGRYRCLRASDIGACHQRKRWFCIATDPTQTEWGGADVDADAFRGELQRRSGPDRLGDETAGVGGETWEQRSGDSGIPSGGEVGCGVGESFNWREYEPAIRRHEATIGRPAPSPVTDDGKLSPRFVEWMMMTPEGWVSDLVEGGVLPIISRAQSLKMLGNSVVQPCVEAAFRSLLGLETHTHTHSRGVTLPTPRSQNGESRNMTPWVRPLDQPQNIENALGRLLERERESNLATPTARDWKDTGDLSNVPVNGLLPRQIQALTERERERLLPTPRVSMAHGPSEAETNAGDPKRRLETAVSSLHQLQQRGLGDGPATETER